MRQIFFLLILIATKTSLAQVKLNNTDLSNPDTNILLLGSNHLKLSPNLELTSLKIKTTNSKLSIENGCFVVKTNNIGFDTITIFRGKQLLISKVYQIQKSQFPFAQLAFSNDSIISIGKILSIPRLNVVCLYKTQSSIVSYSCTITRSTKPLVFEDINGYYLNQDLLFIIKTLKSGDKLKFYDITFLGPDTRAILLKPFTMVIQ